MKFFARVTYVCNACFVIAVILRIFENARKKEGNFNGIIKIQPLESTIVILGYGAVYINLLLNIGLLILLLNKKTITVPQWLVYTNFLFLLLQLYYFFISNY